MMGNIILDIIKTYSADNPIINFVMPVAYVFLIFSIFKKFIDWS